MIPKSILEIIKEEATKQAFVIEIIPSNWGQPAQEVRHPDSNMEESFIAGAKRCYELAMGDMMKHLERAWNAGIRGEVLKYNPEAKWISFEDWYNNRFLKTQSHE